ncbi:hypothetical protein Hanom_Chr03g00244151 [Helianthus anomalus]
MSIWYWVPVLNRTGYIQYRYSFFTFFSTGTGTEPVYSVPVLIPTFPVFRYQYFRYRVYPYFIHFTCSMHKKLVCILCSLAHKWYFQHNYYQI